MNNNMGHTVAVVDDEELLRKTLASVLSSSGQIVSTYKSGAEFLDTLSASDLQKRLKQEQEDAQIGFKYCKDLVATLKKICSAEIARDRLVVPPPGLELG